MGERPSQRDAYLLQHTQSIKEINSVCKFDPEPHEENPYQFIGHQTLQEACTISQYSKHHRFACKQIQWNLA